MEAFQQAFRQIIGWMPALIKASGNTILLTATAVTTALALSVFLALGKISRVHSPSGSRGLNLLRKAASALVRGISSAYVFFFRGTPLLMQLFFIYYVLPRYIPALAFRERFWAAYIAFSLNVAAYLAEIIRAAIQSIPKGQLEASHALGFSYGQTMRMIVIPQAYRRMIPPVCNEFVMVLKDTSLVALIAMTDLTYQTKIIASNRASSLVYIPAMVVYLVMTAFFTIVFNRLEKRLSAKE
ncbi:MAG: amino acid ABC transporter permease [Oscillospiraceae bacterium]|jgi:polar amino acid transport system permease protein|nr:amino acid ABC transporter permease [Oscillospiraceae bacterium]